MLGKPYEQRVTATSSIHIFRFVSSTNLYDLNNPSKLEFLNLLSQDCTVFQCDPTIIDTVFNDLPDC